MGNIDSANNPNQKLKMLYLYKIFNEFTDENHPVTINDLIRMLHEYGVSAERKALYVDIENLQNFGMDIIVIKGRANSYYLGSRVFELPELKLLADAVCSAKFITAKKSKSLLEKIESLASINEGREIQRQLYVIDRAKSMNERIYINVDTLHRAINENKQISFRYFDYGLDKSQIYRKGNRMASPYALTWSDEKYYLIAHYQKYGDKLTNFRVDRMSDISILNTERVAPPEEFDVSEYLNATFSMFSGETVDIVLKFDNSLINVAIDRFGMDAVLRQYDGCSFTLRAKVKPEAPFFGWLFQFGKKVSILSPESVKRDYYKMLNNVINNF